MFFNKKIIYLPIGSSCKVAWYLNKHGLRTEAYPFDWVVIPINSAIKLLNNNFQDFFQVSNLIFLEPTNRLLFKDDDKNPELTEDIITPVYDKKYNILYVHDFSKNGKIEYELIKQKYMKRVRRLQKIWNIEKYKIYCIYDDTELNDWQISQYKKVDYKYIKNDKLLTLKRKKSILISLSDFKKKKEIL